MIFPVKQIADMGFEILATAGTAEVLRRNGVTATVVRKHSEGEGPDGEPTIVRLIWAREVDLVINTPHGATSGGSPRMRRLRHPHRGGVDRHPLHHHHPGTRGRGPGPRGDAPRRHRRPVAAGLGGAARRGPCVRPYDVLFEQVLKRIEPERIHHGAFAAIRAAVR